jgi:hypothetical protein
MIMSGYPVGLYLIRESLTFGLGMASFCTPLTAVVGFEVSQIADSLGFGTRPRRCGFQTGFRDPLLPMKLKMLAKSANTPTMRVIAASVLGLANARRHAHHCRCVPSRSRRLDHYLSVPASSLEFHRYVI